MTAPDLEKQTGLVARMIAPTGPISPELVGVGHHFRYQLGKPYRTFEEVTIDGRRFQIHAERFHLHFFGSSWGDVSRKVEQGERAGQ